MAGRLLDLTVLAAVGVILVALAERPLEASDEPRGETPARAIDEAAGGLVFRLSADEYDTTMNDAGTSAEGIQLKYAFKNVGSQPLQLDIWYPVTSAMQFHVVEPNRTRKTFRLFVPYKKRERRTGSDFITLKPGETYELDREAQIRFPMSGDPNPNEPGRQTRTHWTYGITRPGRYKIRATFCRDADPSATDAATKLKVWTGRVSSNEIVIEVRGRKER